MVRYAVQPNTVNPGLTRGGGGPYGAGTRAPPYSGPTKTVQFTRKDGRPVSFLSRGGKARKARKKHQHHPKNMVAFNERDGDHVAFKGRKGKKRGGHGRGGRGGFQLQP